MPSIVPPCYKICFSKNFIETNQLTKNAVLVALLILFRSVKFMVSLLNDTITAQEHTGTKSTKH